MRPEVVGFMSVCLLAVAVASVIFPEMPAGVSVAAVVVWLFMDDVGRAV